MSISRSTASTGFGVFELDASLMRAIRAAGFDQPRPIQNETIPEGLKGRDVLGLAQTGTGKTAAFALPLLERLLQSPGKGPRTLILAPTRELANQISVEIRLLAKFTKIKVITVYGGVSIGGQVAALRRRPEVIVGCPGRVLDLLQRGVLRTKGIDTLVLDEADHIFDMGFLPELRKIIKTLPPQRQNLLFSASMPAAIRGLADDLLRDPHVVELANSMPASTIDHGLYHVSEENKRALLEHLLKGDDCDSAIVFTRTKHRARRLAEQICRAGHRAVGLQGNMSQSQRDRAMRGFRSRDYDILVATDIAARGIDVSNVSHVINFDVPNTPEAYTHRIGRTGRAECQGMAFTFVTRADRGWVRATERMIGTSIPRRQAEMLATDSEATRERRPEPRTRKHRAGSRGAAPRGRRKAAASKGGRGATPSQTSSRTP